MRERVLYVVFMTSFLVLVVALILAAFYLVDTRLECLSREPRFIVPFETVSQGTYSGHPEVNNYIIDNREDWKNLWQKITAKTWPSPPLPEVNFNKDMLLARFMGERTSGGYRVEFLVVIEAEEKVYITAIEVSPGPDCGVTAAMTQPYHVVQIPRTEKEIVFNIIETVRRCSK